MGVMQHIRAARAASTLLSLELEAPTPGSNASAPRLQRRKLFAAADAAHYDARRPAGQVRPGPRAMGCLGLAR